MKKAETVLMFKALADRSRLMIINSLMERSQYVEELAQRLGLAPSTVSFHLKKLEEAGLVGHRKEQYYVIYHVKMDLFEKSLKELTAIDDIRRDHQEERLEQYRQKVIKAFFLNGKLVKIPSQLKKRTIILEELARVFEPGKVYPEKEINLAIADFHEDFCAIRRAFISVKIMERKAGKYWLTEQYCQNVFHQTK